jgi:hypothetical protein
MSRTHANAQEHGQKRIESVYLRIALDESLSPHRLD